MHHHSKLAAVAALAPLTAMAQVSASTPPPFALIIDSTNQAFNHHYLSLYHSSAANSYLTLGTTTPAPASVFTVGQDTALYGPRNILQTTGIFGTTQESDCDFQTISNLNAGPLQCGANVGNATNDYPGVSFPQSGLTVAGIEAFFICDTLASSGLIPSTIVGSTDGNAPNATAKPTGQTMTFFSNCQPLGGSIQMVSPSSSTSTSVSASTASASAPASTTVTSTVISTITSSCDSTTTTSYSQPITVQPITVQSTVSSSSSFVATTVQPHVIQSTSSSSTATTLTPLLPVTGTPATSLPRISQIGDGQIQATTPVTSAPALFTGAAHMLGRGRDLVMLAAGAAAFVMV